MNKKISLFAYFILTHLSLWAQRVIVHFEQPLASTPSVSKANLRFDKDFAYSFTLDDGTDDAFLFVLPLFQGGTIKKTNQTFNGLFFTDGCGNDLPFKAGIAWNASNPIGTDPHTGEVAGMLTWRQLDSLYALGWDVLNHSYSHRARWSGPMSRADYESEIRRNLDTVRKKTTAKIEMPLFVVPSGDNFYQDFALQSGQKAVFDQSGDVVGYGGLQINGNVNLTNLRLHRQLLQESISSLNQLPKVVQRLKSDTHIWYNEFEHRVDETNGVGFNFNAFRTYMQQLADAYGKKGSDRVWMAPLQEVFEYLTYRQNVNFSSKINGKTLEMTFDAAKVPTWLRRKTLTLVVNSTQNFNKIDVPEGVKVTFSGSGTKKIINFDFTNFKGKDLNSTKDLAENIPFTIAPNPTEGVITLDFDVEITQGSAFQITNAAGKILQTGTLSTQKKQTISLHDAPKGVYFLSILNKNNKTTKAFVKI